MQMYPYLKVLRYQIGKVQLWMMIKQENQSYFNFAFNILLNNKRKLNK